MKQLKLTILITIIANMLLINTHAQTWNKKADFTGADRHGAYCFALDGKVYLGGGEVGGNPSSDLYEYDPANDSWTAKNGMPQGMTEGIAFSINGKGYVGLGKSTSSTSYLKGLWEYDTANDSWTPKAELPFPSGVFRSRVFVVNNKAYVLVGTSSNFVAQNEMFEYDPATDKWAQKANYPGNVRPDLPFTFAIGSKGYVSCGEVLQGGTRKVINKTYEYDPAADSWIPKADFPGDARHMGSSFVYNGKAYCGLGTYRDASWQSVYLDDFYAYDASTDTWSPIPAFPSGKIRRGAVATTSTNAYLGTGEGPGTSKSWYEFGFPLSINNIYTKKEINTLQVHPNPSKNIITVNLDNAHGSKYAIYNSTGQVITKGSISNNTINVSALADGMYLLEVQKGELLLKSHIAIHK